MQHFWFRIQCSAADLFMLLMQLFIQNIRLNYVLIAYAMAAAIQPNKSNANSVKANAIRSPDELCMKIDANDGFTNINGDCFDHALFCCNAANQQIIIHNKPTDQL